MFRRSGVRSTAAPRQRTVRVGISAPPVLQHGPKHVEAEGGASRGRRPRAGHPAGVPTAGGARPTPSRTVTWSPSCVPPIERSAPRSRRRVVETRVSRGQDALGVRAAPARKIRRAGGVPRGTPTLRYVDVTDAQRAALPRPGVVVGARAPGPRSRIQLGEGGVTGRVHINGRHRDTLGPLLATWEHAPS